MRTSRSICPIAISRPPRRDATSHCVPRPQGQAESPEAGTLFAPTPCIMESIAFRQLVTDLPRTTCSNHTILVARLSAGWQLSKSPRLTIPMPTDGRSILVTSTQETMNRYTLSLAARAVTVIAASRILGEPFLDFLPCPSPDCKTYTFVRTHLPAQRKCLPCASIKMRRAHHTGKHKWHRGRSIKRSAYAHCTASP